MMHAERKILSWKRGSMLLLGAVVAVLLLFSLTGCGGSSTNTSNGTEGLIYEQADGSYVVTGYVGDEVNIVIPDTYNDIPVIGVEGFAFDESEVQSVVFGKNITYIGNDCFNYTTLLKSVTFTSEYISLDKWAFLRCTSLTDVSFTQDNYTLKLSDYAFYGCEALTELDFSKADADTFQMTDESFAESTNLATIIVPSGVSVPTDLDDCDAEIVYK